MREIVAIFTAEDLAEMRAAMKQIIIDQFKIDLEEMDTYLFDPDDISDMIHGMYEKILDELKIELTEKIKEKLFAKLDKIG